VAVEAIRRLEVGGGIGNPGRGQAILISGESGAGKTEANKEVLRFIAKYYGSEDHKVEEKVFYGRLCRYWHVIRC
jgi:predicted ATPase